MKFSIVIVNYNVRYFLEQCLHSVLKACRGMQAEVIVVDNNSTDGSTEMMKQKFPSVILIENKDNKGFSKANNQAIQISKGEYVLLLNPDTIVEEDTFSKCIHFMDAHPDAGGLGVKMIDGSGKFLPESKRGLPTPSVAFYKISGLASLFPRSKTFGRYHLGFLDKDEVNKVDVLAGAFMLLRRATLDKAGLLDEDFFMYGEDIDLSYRITKAGYHNYYFPETRIIHYKGESTKKTSVNYVFVFYNAMAIFARKHFSRGNAALFTVLIRLAIYLRAGAAIINHFFRKAFYPLLDAALILTGMYFIKEYWSHRAGVNYPEAYMLYAVPFYIFIWITSVFFSGGYDKPIRLQKIIRGIFYGTLLILVIYALLPETYRFSRAMTLFGALWAIAEVLITRLLFNLIGIKELALESGSRKRLLIVGQEDEANRVLSLLQMSETTHNFIGYVKPDENYSSHEQKKFSEFDKYYLGAAANLREISGLYNIDEIIYCGRDVASNSIMNYMSTITENHVEHKIAPPESLYIIGSSSVNNPGELYIIDINSITRSVNKRNKRMMDFTLSFVFLILSPVLILFQSNPSGYFSNVFNVLFGRKSWVGYSEDQKVSIASLPKIRKGVLNPLDSLSQSSLDETTINRLNSLYAKDYHIYIDLNIIRKGLKELGRI